MTNDNWSGRIKDVERWIMTFEWLLVRLALLILLLIELGHLVMNCWRIISE